MIAIAALTTAPAAISEPSPRYGVGRTAPAVETVSGALVDAEGLVTTAVEEVAVVIPGADAVEDWVPEDEVMGGDGAAPEEGTAGGTSVSAGGAGGMTVAVSDGGPLRGAVAVDSTEVTGGAGGGGGAS
jgi:hypothetical protein